MSKYRLFTYEVYEENMVDYIDYHVNNVFETIKTFVDENDLAKKVSDFCGIELTECGTSDEETIYYDDVENGKPICELRKIA